MLLEGKGAVVTGGGRGIGSEIARALVREGASVVVCARTSSQIESVAEELRQSGGQAWAVACDVTQPEQIQRLAESASDLLGTVHILVNNAGIASSAPLKSIELDEWNRLMTVNATAPFLCTQAFMPGMLAAGWGRVVTIASIAGKVGHPYVAAYSASKHAVIGFTRAVATEVAGKGVTVNAICPGYVNTPMTDQSVARIVDRTGMSETDAREHLRLLSPQARLIEPEEVAHQVISLCDPLARGINGQAVVLDGGTVQS
jgi:NAD(P)-dependent dehydrogenase (short-subunit alcohol dehydrogenase family)